MSPKSILITVGAALVAFGEALQNIKAEDAAPAGDTEAPKRRGRPPGGTATTPADTGATGPTDDDAARLAKNKALIAPLVEGGNGDEVKKVIAKYSKTGLKDIPAASQADFAKDIDALSY